MNALNRILIVLIVLLTIGSAVLGVLLYQNRNLMRDRADLMAETMVDMVASLDQDSQTDTARDVTFTPPSPATGKDAGTLSWQQYLEDRPGFSSINNAVRQSRDLAANINTQRNRLADALAETAALMEHAEDQLGRSLKSVEQYQAKTEVVLRLADAVRSRTEDMIEAFIAIGRNVDVNVRRNDFLQRRQEHDDQGNLIQTGFEHRNVLTNLQTGVSRIAEAHVGYRDSLVQAVEEISQHEWTISTAQLRDPDTYAAALREAEENFRAINAELVRSQERQEALARAENELTATRRRFQELINERNQLARRLQRMGEIIEEREVDPTVEVPEVEPVEEDPQEVFPRDTTGRVLEVNPQFGFIIIDLGAEDNVMRGLHLLVNREGRFIARVEVTEVDANHSIAEVIPRVRVDDVRVGDTLISP